VASDWEGKGITYELDAAGNLTRESRSNWTETLYTYDPADRVIGISHMKWGDTIAAVTYSRDKMGRTLSETRTPYVPPLFPGGTQPGAYNDVNQVVAFGGHAHTYDKDGNLIAVALPQGFSAAYDCENRMTSVTRGGIATAHSYDGLGNRVKSITGSAARNFHYDHLGRMLFETDGSKKVTARYIYAGNRLAAVETAGGNYFYHFDQAGSTLALTDGEGNVAASYSYLPFGAVASKTGTVVNPFTYVGAYGVMDEGEGLFFMRSRYYDADTGRFIQKDPAGMADGPNLYRYARNNPVDFIDPDGRQADPSDKELERMRSFATYNITSETVSRDVAPAEPDRDINLMEYGAHGAVAIGLLKVVKAMARSAGVREEDALELVLQEEDAKKGLLRTTFILEKLIELERYKERLSRPSKCDPPGPGTAEPDVSRGFADFE
jgi:RHS repeat-associated protein